MEIGGGVWWRLGRSLGEVGKECGPGGLECEESGGGV